VGFDQLHPGDDRLAGLVWSWRTDEPAIDVAAACAALGGDARFFADDCTAPRPVACRAVNGRWAVTPAPVAWADGEDACRAAGHVGAGVPVNGWDNGLLRTAADEAGVSDLWLAYGQDATGRWVPGIPADDPELGAVAPGQSGTRPTSPNGQGHDHGHSLGRGRPVAATRPQPRAIPLFVGATLLGAATLTARRRHGRRHL